MTRILLVDDDRQLRRALHITLRAAGYELGVAATGTEALARAASEPPDIVILDLGLPDLDGVAVLEGLRGWCAAPVIVLSARHEEKAKVRALDAGADEAVRDGRTPGEAARRQPTSRAAPRGHSGDH
jgi:two-component system KDP operon response regulator KdpE